MPGIGVRTLTDREEKCLDLGPIQECSPIAGKQHGIQMLKENTHDLSLPMITPKQRKVDSENRSFKERWELDYFFIRNRDKPQCLICSQTLAVCKEYNVKRHYYSQHEKVYGQYTGELRIAMMNDLRSKHFDQTNAPPPSVPNEKAAVKASYVICEEIVKRKRAFSDGPFVKACAIKMARAFGNEDLAKHFESVSLSHQTVARRISVMDQYVNRKVHNVITNCAYFSVALDENTDITGISQLIIFIRTVDDNFETSEELLKLTSLQGTRKEDDIYNEVKCAVAEYGGFKKCTSIITDGAKSTVVKNLCLSTLLKRDGIECMMLHCIVHEEALIGTLLKMTDVMEIVIRITNLISDKKCALTRRRFKAYLEELEAAYGDLPLHKNVRWLSAGNYLSRFFSLRKEMYLFLMEIKCDPVLEESLIDGDFLSSLAFLTDITLHLNYLNKKLQEKDQQVSQLYNHISSFRNTLMLLKLNLLRNELTHLQSCNELFQEIEENGTTLDFSRFVPKIDILIDNFTQRFQEFNKMNSSFRLFNNPLNTNIANEEAKYQMELCEIQSDMFLASRVESGVPFFKLLPKDKYPNMRNLGLKMTSMFGSTYICEKAFSDLNYIKSKYRSSISNGTLQQILRLSTTNITVDIDELLSQLSH
ncbi:general transcription factor II-I repeat domain-containing 2-like [Pelobates cultripes]|uniref:General transcription factor II-I repeat domain-containing 2-like n=1 Tax=Pelobates cultripes TaxID=61616 RepID=A0AAD1WXI9_PELCU|nr:general transcription factor II-I repeat domain-containing 2-like [Pelobates cultripes]